MVYDLLNIIISGERVNHNWLLLVKKTLSHNKPLLLGSMQFLPEKLWSLLLKVATLNTVTSPSCCVRSAKCAEAAVRRSVTISIDVVRKKVMSHDSNKLFLSVLSGLQSVFNETHISSDVKVKPAVAGCRKTTSFRQRSRLGLHEAEAFDRNLRPELMKCSSTFGISWN